MMQSGRTIITAITLTALLIGMFNTNIINAGETIPADSYRVAKSASNGKVLTPSWSATRENHNQSFLINLKGGDASGLNFSRYLLGSEMVKTLPQQFQDMTRKYEHRARYGLVTSEEILNHHKQIMGFGTYMGRHTLVYQVNTNLEKAEKRNDDVRTFKRGYDTAKEVAKGEMGFSPSSNFNMGIKTNIPSQKGQFWATSPVADAAVDLSVGDPWEYDPFNFGQKADENSKADPVRFSLSRKIPYVDVNTEVNYGLVSENVSSKISRKITDHLNAEISDTRSFKSPANQEVKFMYDLKF